MALYDRLRGESAVGIGVDRFYERVLADQVLAPFFQDVNVARSKTHPFAFLSQVPGGPRQYSGAAMSRAHTCLEIEHGHFEVVSVHFAETLRELSVGESIVAQVAAVVTPLAAEIVNPVGTRSAGVTG
jgi:hemoglobin